MNFSILSDCHKKWQDILVIGKTIERDDKKYHILGMTLSDEAKLYIIEPYVKREPINRKGPRTHRRMLKEHQMQSRSAGQLTNPTPPRSAGRLMDKKRSCSYLHCSDFYLGEERLQVQGGTSGALEYSVDDYGTIQLFSDMMSAGWRVPEWLKGTDWDSLQLVTLNITNSIADMEKLPHYTPEMPITITHSPDSIGHILEKPVTLHVGKSRSFSFIDDEGDTVWCHVNSVALIDVWKNTEEELKNPKLAERFSPEQLEEMRKHMYDALKQCCPEGMCYIGIEYECSKNYDLVFHSRQYLASRPETHQGSSHFLMMHLKPDQETGSHGLPLKGRAIDTPVPPDTTKIPAELFLYYERIDAWNETLHARNTPLLTDV